jgi:hypothetical protein
MELFNPRWKMGRILVGLEEREPMRSGKKPAWMIG